MYSTMKHEKEIYEIMYNENIIYEINYRSHKRDFY